MKVIIEKMGYLFKVRIEEKLISCKTMIDGYVLRSEELVGIEILDFKVLNPQDEEMDLSFKQEQNFRTLLTKKLTRQL